MAAVMRHTVAVFIIFVLFAGVIWFAAKAWDPLYVAAGTTATPAAVSPLGHLDTILSLTGDDAKQLSLGNSLQSHQTVLAGRASTPSIAVTVVSATGHTITGTWGTMTVGPSLANNTTRAFDGAPVVTETVIVSATTAFSMAGQPASLADVHPGIMVRATGSWTGQATIVASAIEITLPQRQGVVTALHGTTMTITEFNARSVTITLGSATTYQRAGHPASLHDIAAGSLIDAEGSLNAGGSIMIARRVTIQLPHVTGIVSSVSGNTLIVQALDGTKSTVKLTSNTLCSGNQNRAGSRCSIAKGNYLSAEGTLNHNGPLTALRVNVITGYKGSTTSVLGISPEPMSGIPGEFNSDPGSSPTAGSNL